MPGATKNGKSEKFGILELQEPRALVLQNNVLIKVLFHIFFQETWKTEKSTAPKILQDLEKLLSEGHYGQKYQIQRRKGVTKSWSKSYKMYYF